MKKNPLLKLVIAALAIFEVALATSSYAIVPVSWNASVDNAWENALNWTPALEPTNNTFDVEIGLLTTAPCNFSSAFQIDALTLSNSSAHLNLIPAATLAFTSDINNNGTILVNTTGANTTTQLRFDASAQITGSGSIVLNDVGNTFNVADLNLQNFTVTHGVNHTVRGHGTIIGFNSGTLINNGTINGDSASGFNLQMDMANTSNQNNGTIKATNGGVLGFYSGTIDQTGGGTFLADGANSVVQFGGSSIATLIGGTTNTANSGILLGVLTIWQGVTNNGTVQIPGGDIIVVTGTGLTNNHTILVNSTDPINSTSNLRFDQSGTLDGTGSVTLNGVGFNRANFNLQNFTVTHGANHTIHGYGTVIGFNGATLINNGTINGDDSTGSMQLDLANTSNQNNATIEATNGGLLAFNSGTIDQTGGGTFLADGANSLVTLGVGGPSAVFTIIGGIVTTANGGIVQGVYGNLISCTNNGDFQIPGNDIVVVTGTGLTNNGTVTINDGTGAASTAQIRFDASGTLDGTGSLLLKGFGNTYNIADLNLNVSIVTNGPNHLVHGLGSIIGFNGATLINNGTINGDDAGGGSMQLGLANTTNENNSLIEATNGAVLNFGSGTIDQSGGGTFLADGNGSIVYLGCPTCAPVPQFATIDGGTLNTANGGIIESGLSVLGGTITNAGAFEILSNSTTLVYATTLTNNGTMTLDASDSLMRFDLGNTAIGGSGFIALTNGAQMVVNGGQAVTNGSNHTIKGNGSVTIVGGGTLTNNGMISPGLSPGQLNVNGNLQLGSTSNLVFEIGGTTQVTQYDLLNKIDGAAQTLGGNLVVRLINGFTPASTDVFTVLATQTTLQGAFSNVASGGQLATADGHGMFTVTYSGQNNVVLSQFVAVSPSSKVVTVSTHAPVKDSRQTVSCTFTINGTDATNVIIRGLGASFGGLSDPVVTLRNSNGATIASNDNWKSTQQAQIQATGLAPTNDKESAIVITLVPGTYTATLSGQKKSSGIGLVDVHDLSPTANSALAIMSGLGFVGNRDEGLFGDFSIGGSDGGPVLSDGGGGKVRVLIRVLGPSIEGLQDPTLELDNANGTQIFFNDNWQDSQAAEIQATSLAPTNPKESAIVANLDPGDYIAVVRGKLIGKGKKAKLATGFARVEVYQLPQDTK